MLKKLFDRQNEIMESMKGIDKAIEREQNAEGKACLEVMAWKYAYRMEIYRNAGALAFIDQHGLLADFFDFLEKEYSRKIFEKGKDTRFEEMLAEVQYAKGLLKDDEKEEKVG